MKLFECKERCSCDECNSVYWNLPDIPPMTREEAERSSQFMKNLGKAHGRQRDKMLTDLMIKGRF